MPYPFDSGVRCVHMSESFILDGMTLRPCYNSQIDEIGGCLDETDEFQACEDCRYYGKCPMTGGDEEE